MAKLTDKMKIERIEANEVEQAYLDALDACRRILFVVHHEDPAVAMGATLAAALMAYNMFCSTNDRDMWFCQALDIWDSKDEIAFDLFGGPVTPKVH